MYFATLLTNQQSQTPKTTANRPYSDQHHDRYESEWCTCCVFKGIRFKKLYKALRSLI